MSAMALELQKLGNRLLVSSSRGMCWSAMPKWMQDYWAEELLMTKQRDELAIRVDFFETVVVKMRSNGSWQVTCQDMKVIYMKHPDPSRAGYVFKYFDAEKQRYDPRIRTESMAKGHAFEYLYRRFRIKYIRESKAAEQQELANVS